MNEEIAFIFGSHRNFADEIGNWETIFCYVKIFIAKKKLVNCKLHLNYCKLIIYNLLPFT